MPVRPPTKTIRVHILKDDRDKKEFIGTVFDDSGEEVKHFMLNDGRDLERTLSFIIADSLSRNGYRVIMDSDAADTEVVYEVSGSIMDFELTEKPAGPRPNDSIVPELKPQNSPAPQIGQSNLNIISNGFATIVLTISEPAANNRSSRDEIWFRKENVETTAQEMATMLVAHIVTESNSFIRGFNLDTINNVDQDKDGPEGRP
jgi:hypothetical protein